jgi:hypothetical protein
MDLEDEIKARPNCISANLDPEYIYKAEWITLLKEFKDCFAWEYYDVWLRLIHC